MNGLLGLALSAAKGALASDVPAQTSPLDGNAAAERDLQGSLYNVAQGPSGGSNVLAALDSMLAGRGLLSGAMSRGADAFGGAPGLAGIAQTATAGLLDYARARQQPDQIANVGVQQPWGRVQLPVQNAVPSALQVAGLAARNQAPQFRY